MMIVNDGSRVVNKLEASLTDDARVIIYDCHMFIVQATSFIWTNIILRLDSDGQTIKPEFVFPMRLFKKLLMIILRIALG